MRIRRKVKTLYVEDDPQDVELLQIAAQKCGGSLEFQVINDGELACRYLDSVRNGEAAHPDIILLDLNLPKKDGISVLREVKAGPLKTMPVMILSSSNNDQDVAAAYASGANIYFEKPITMSTICDMVRILEKLWADYAKLPPPVLVE